MLPPHNLERELAMLQLDLYFRQHPEKAFTLALNYYLDYLNLADDHKQLQAEFEALQKENVRLKSSLQSRRSRSPEGAVRPGGLGGLASALPSFRLFAHASRRL